MSYGSNHQVPSGGIWQRQPQPLGCLSSPSDLYWPCQPYRSLQLDLAQWSLSSLKMPGLLVFTHLLLWPEALPLDLYLADSYPLWWDLDFPQETRGWLWVFVAGSLHGLEEEGSVITLRIPPISKISLILCVGIAACSGDYMEAGWKGLRERQARRKGGRQWKDGRVVEASWNSELDDEN